ncbi:hypothetical protein L7F22_051344 [Adiantum nelumboides]|nr:hypothetical protein [Adiantum nelumboides]
MEEGELRIKLGKKGMGKGKTRELPCGTCLIPHGKEQKEIEGIRQKLTTNILSLDPSRMIPGDSVVPLQPSSSSMSAGMPAEGSQFALAHVTPEGEQEQFSPSSSQQQQQQQLICSPLPPPQQPNGAYPPALASHEAVVADRDLFYDTLNKFHASLGTRLSIPTIGGKELDLHLLYVEVSSRGGLEQVIRERKWKEVTVVFHFPPTTTSASFVLRKYYVSLLHHYEQVYFFGTQGSLVTPPVTASIPNQSPGHQSVDNGSMINNGLENGELVIKKRRRRIEDSPQLQEADFAVPIGHAVSGVIDGKFERGYLVTVTVGTEKLRGILYHLPLENVTPQFASVSEMAKGVVMDSAPEVRRRRRRRRKDEMPKKDPNAPKPNRSGYNFFFQEHRKRLKALHPDKDKELSKMIGELWNKQTEEERAITEQINDVSFRLKLPDTWKIHNAFHVSLLKPFKGDVLDDGEPDEQPEVEENEEILVPEQILAHKVTKNKDDSRALQAEASDGLTVPVLVNQSSDNVLLGVEHYQIGLVYQERGIKDKERYKKEMEIYRGSQNVQNCDNDASEARIDDGGNVLPTTDITGRAEHSLSSLSETDSLHMAEEEKPKSDVGTS